MIPEFVRGAIAPVFTAFNEDGTLDDAGQRHFLDYLVNTKAVSAYFVRSGMGQMFTFGMDDVKQLAKNACAHMQGRGAVLVGTSGIWDRNRDKLADPVTYTQQAIELSQFAEQCGAAGVVFTIPEGLPVGPDETPACVTKRFFEQVVTATQLPVLIYQPPGTLNSFCVDVDLISWLADLPSVKGMKVSTIDAEYILDLTWAVRGKDFGFICGAEMAFLAGLVSGARAVIGQGTTINPQVLKAVQDLYEKGDIDGAVDAQRATNVLVQQSKSPVLFFKRYVTEKGYPIKPYGRYQASHPYAAAAPTPITDDEYNTYKQLLDSYLEKY